MEDRAEVRIPSVGLPVAASQTHLNTGFSKGEAASGEVGFWDKPHTMPNQHFSVFSGRT